MSLTVNSGSSASYEPISEGTHLAVCSMLIDLGQQFSEKFGTSSRKVLIAWEIPDETIELDDGPVPRTISTRYTASLNERSILRRDLEAWRGKKFTDEELAGFDLRAIVGKSCLLNVTHTKGQNGKTYANVGAIMSLPRGQAPAKLSEPPVVYDIDADPVEDVEKLPNWIAEIIHKSPSYEEKLNAKPTFTVVEDDGDGELPF